MNKITVVLFKGFGKDAVPAVDMNNESTLDAGLFKNSFCLFLGRIL